MRAARPDKLAIISPSGNLTWREFNDRSQPAGPRCSASGACSRAMASPCWRTTGRIRDVWAATQRSGLRLTAVNWHQSAELIAYVVDNCDARALVASGAFAAGATEAAQGCRTS